MMTKTAATEKARRHLRYGHYKPSPDRRDLYVECPDCRERVDYVWSALDEKRPEALLRDRLVDHLLNYCDGKAARNG